jgi:hypothetical protein
MERVPEDRRKKKCARPAVEVRVGTEGGKRREHREDKEEAAEAEVRSSAFKRTESSSGEETSGRSAAMEGRVPETRRLSSTGK